MNYEKKCEKPVTADSPNGLLELSLSDCECGWELHAFIVDASDAGVIVQPMVRLKVHGELEFTAIEVLDGMGGCEYTVEVHFKEGVPNVVVTKRKAGKEEYETNILAEVALQ